MAFEADGGCDPGSVLCLLRNKSSLPLDLSLSNEASLRICPDWKGRRKKHSCVLIFICNAANLSHKMRPQEGQQSTAYWELVGVKIQREHLFVS